jgi:hypothetical protein
MSGNYHRCNVLVGGSSNVMTSCGGGAYNLLNSVLVGGSNNFVGCTSSIKVCNAVLVGGLCNYNSGAFSGVVAGQSNCIIGGLNGSGNISCGHQFIGGGQSNVVAGIYSSVVGGLSNCATGCYSSNLGGCGNTASAYASTALGGYGNSSASCFSSTIGVNSLAYLYGQNALASGQFSATGDAQSATLITRRSAGSLTTGATMLLSLDGTGSTNLIIPNGNNRLWNVQVNWNAVVTSISGTATGVTVGDVIAGNTELAFKRVGGTSSVVGTIRNVSTYDASMSAATMTYSAGASQELALTFTGPTFAGGGSVTVRSVARVQLTETAW